MCLVFLARTSGSPQTRLSSVHSPTCELCRCPDCGAYGQHSLRRHWTFLPRRGCNCARLSLLKGIRNILPRTFFLDAQSLSVCQFDGLFVFALREMSFSVPVLYNQPLGRIFVTVPMVLSSGSSDWVFVAVSLGQHSIFCFRGGCASCKSGRGGRSRMRRSSSYLSASEPSWTL